VGQVTELSEEAAWEHADRLICRYPGLKRMPRKANQHRVLIRIRPEYVTSRRC